MDKNQKPAAEETSEIDDKALDQVVGGITAMDDWEAPLKKTTTIKPGTSSFGGEDWGKR